MRLKATYVSAISGLVLSGLCIWWFLYLNNQPHMHEGDNGMFMLYPVAGIILFPLCGVLIGLVVDAVRAVWRRSARRHERPGRRHGAC